jgi:epoxyqueuosine reductase QueG
MKSLLRRGFMPEKYAEPLPDWAVCPFERLEGSLLPCRAAARLPKEPRSVLVAVFPYLLPEDKYKGRNVARYAAVTDYHQAVLRRLEQACALLREEYLGGEFVPFVDNSPIDEKRAAVLAGLGVRGRNTLFFHPRWGSWVFLGCIVSSVELPAPPRRQPKSAPCASCRLCEERCPAAALSGGKLEREKCLSHKSQRKGARRTEISRQSGVLWGCDLCQECCPMNRNTPCEPLPELAENAVPLFEPFAKDRVWSWRFA